MQTIIVRSLVILFSFNEIILYYYAIAEIIGKVLQPGRPRGPGLCRQVCVRWPLTGTSWAGMHPGHQARDPTGLETLLRHDLIANGTGGQ